ncbi:hypothetical protein [uncultured Thiohalocapsa sp.]|uniref:hypothetical protein n=1 Tax=uncultured Thiohalocapsa sp. TaxID=768990 RepID=UPI0025DC42E5|nr:hypothetical protein [uncultured Thiohalocapsa sp.]
MRKLANIVLLAGSCCAAMPLARAATCPETYVVQTNDTLRAIAAETLGSADRFTEIYEHHANGPIIGEDPDLIRPGMELFIPPCSAERAPARTAAPADPPPDSADSERSYPRVIHIVSSWKYWPFTALGSASADADGAETFRPPSGMLTEVVKAAFAHSGEDLSIEIDFIDDWAGMLNVLVKKRKYDMTYPWFKPDCTDVDALPRNMRIRCEYVFSDPLTSVTIAFYRLDQALIQDHDKASECLRQAISESELDHTDLRECRICRPEGYQTFDLAERGIPVDDDNVFVQANDIEGCFRKLDAYEVDYVTLNRYSAEEALARMGIEDDVTSVDSLAYLLDLHIVAHSFNDTVATKWLRAFNHGLKEIKRNRRYDSIKSLYDQRHRDRVARLAAQSKESD